MLFIGCRNKIKEEKFNSEKWKTGTQIERGNMSTDLVESKILIGKTKPEILNLLGQPKDSDETNFHYIIDFGYMTPFHLDIMFDQNNLRANQAKISD